MEAAATPSSPTGSGPHARIEGRVTVLVVSSPLLRIVQGLVGFAQFLELFLGLLVAWIFVRVVLDGQFAIGLLHQLRRGIPLHTEHLVIVPFVRGCHGSGLARSVLSRGTRLASDDHGRRTQEAILHAVTLAVL